MLLLLYLRRGLPVLILRLLIFWYTSQTVFIRWGHCTSFSFKVSNGVRQGGVLSPVLFNVYMDDLSSVLRDSFTGCSFSNVLYNHFFYADDIVLLAPSSKGLQKLIDLSVFYADSHNISFNTKKTVCMSFLPRNLNINPSPCLLLKNSHLAFTSSTKYLGVFISRDFTDDCDISRQMRGFYIRCNYLMRNFKSCTDDVKCSLFTSFCANIYAGHCWFNFKQSSLSKITVSYNNSLDVFYPTLVFAELVSCLSLVMSRHSLNFCENLFLISGKDFLTHGMF